MRCLVVHAHPDPQSFSTALCQATVLGLERAGHDVDIIDLYDLNYRSAMTAEEHRQYETVARNHPDPHVVDHIRLLQKAEALIFVYPTWWSGLPAIMKAWLDRTLLPEIAFVLDDNTQKVKPGLSNIRHLVGITTTGSPTWFVRGVGDAGRRTILRTVRVICHWRCRRHWHSMPSLDTSTPEQRTEFLTRVTEAMSKI